ncbi:hypothetical protein C8R43DRAFT_234999 [Mycena crocata]|nr:hypothetical protein C8R43DRAFT_234999 [Mycena crocata]
MAKRKIWSVERQRVGKDAQRSRCVAKTVHNELGGLHRPRGLAGAITPSLHLHLASSFSSCHHPLSLDPTVTTRSFVGRTLFWTPTDHPLFLARCAARCLISIVSSGLLPQPLGSTTPHPVSYPVSYVASLVPRPSFVPMFDIILCPPLCLHVAFRLILSFIYLSSLFFASSLFAHYCSL